jgi:hypothetical protein
MTKDEALAFDLALEALESWMPTWPNLIEKQKAAITAIKQARSAPVQKPVATIDSLEQEIYENTREFVSLNVMEWLLNRLNTTPPAAQRQWVSLTDEEYAEAEKCVWAVVSLDDTEKEANREFARAIEAKLKEKNT